MEELNWPSPEDLLGQQFVDDWQKQYDDLSERSSDIELMNHLSPEEIDRLSGGLTELDLTENEEFLRIQVIRYNDNSGLGNSGKNVRLVDFIGEVVEDIKSSSFS